VDQLKFLYIDYGGHDSYFSELRYSLATLLDFDKPHPESVLVYTDNVAKYARLPVTAVSIRSDLDEYTLNGTYHYRVKPFVIKRAIEDNKDTEKILFLDTDTYVKASLASKAAKIDATTALMNRFEKRDPYPGDCLDHLELTTGKTYSYDRKVSSMYNSGVVGVSRNHISCLDDAIQILDGMLKAGFGSHTIEQCALSEAFRINGVRIQEVKTEVEHYWRKTDKGYMHKKLKLVLGDDAALPTGRISHNWFLPRLGKRL
jgi:hypothetical protein